MGLSRLSFYESIVFAAPISDGMGVQNVFAVAGSGEYVLRGNELFLAQFS